MLRKTLIKSWPNFYHYFKTIEAQAKKNGFLIKKKTCKEERVKISKNFIRQL